MRAVLDPNVIVSGLISSTGAPARVLATWQEGRFEVLVSPLLLAELRRVLAYPKLRRHVSPAEAETATRWLSSGAHEVKDPSTKQHLRSADPADDYLIALAAEHRAALVSGDRHLLELSGRLPVYSAREFLDLLRD